MQIKTRNKTLVAYMLLALSSLIVHLPVMAHASQFRWDFGAHIERALRMPETFDLVSHPLFHATFLLVHRLFGQEPQLSAVAAIMLVMTPVPVIAFALLKKCVGNHVPDGALMILSIALSIMSPITIWTNSFMLGYLNPIVYHNPTSITLRLFVIPISVLAFRVFQNQTYRDLNHRIYNLLLCAILMILSILAKPSFALALLPGCLLLAIWQVLRRGRVDWILLALGVFLPAALILGLQAMLSFLAFESSSQIKIGLFTLMKLYIPNWRIPIQLLLSIVFPLGVSLLYAKQASRNLFLCFAWTVFMCAMSMTYLLYETGARLWHGNFLWTGYSAVFLLMFASTMFLLQQYAREARHGRGRLQIVAFGFSRKFALSSLLLGLHVLSGIAYYFRFLGTTSLP